MISDAVAPAVVRSLPTLITFLSIFCSIVERSLTISTPFNWIASSSIAIVFKLTSLFSVSFTDFKIVL